MEVGKGGRVVRWQVEKGGRVVRGQGGSSSIYSRVGDTGWVQYFIFMFLMLMLIALAKSWSVRVASYQPAFMVSCQAISHTCLPCLPSGRTLF